LEDAALAACGGGGRYVADPPSCQFDPMTIVCPPGEDHRGCLSAAQAAAAGALYRGLVLPSGQVVYPGYTPGAESAWSGWITGPARAKADKAQALRFSGGFFANFVFGDPNYDILKLDLASAPAVTAELADILNSTDPNLKRFRARGGKLIQYHGWNDPAIPARGSIVYYEDVRRTMGDPADFYRLYMIPGMLHCGGGPGPNNVNWMRLIQNWVEAGKAPGVMVAKSRTRAQAICPYPAHGTITEYGNPRHVPRCLDGDDPNASGRD
jgi:Tannase and feruloyl esterase